MINTPPATLEGCHGARAPTRGAPTEVIVNVAVGGNPQGAACRAPTLGLYKNGLIDVNRFGRIAIRPYI